MALDYYLHVGCPLQDPRRPRAFLESVKIRAFLEMLDGRREEIEEQQGCPLDEVGVTLGFVVPVAGGEPTNEPTVGQMRCTWREIETRARPICPDCPVNWRSRPMGCFAAISYPIGEEAERWLVERFAPPLGAQDHLVRRLVEDEISGAHLDARRPLAPDDEPSLLAAAEPARKRLTPEGPEVSSSQLLECLLSSQPTLDPRLLFSLCVDFHVLEPPREVIVEIADRLERECGRDDMADFFSGGVTSMLFRRGDGELGKLVFGEAAEEEDAQITEEERAMLEEGAMLSLFEPRPTPIKPPPEMDWLKERLQGAPILLAAEAGDTESTFQIKRFLYACWKALLGGAAMVVDG